MTPHPLAGVYEWRGKTYHGLASVAQAAGVKRTTVWHHLDRHGHLDRLGIGPQCGNPLGRGVPGKQVSRFGRTWPSIGTLARDAGRARSTVKFWLDRGDDDLILAALMAAGASRTAQSLKAAEMVDGPSLDAYRAGGRKGGLLNRRIAA